jgi:hypothetical protein
MKDDQKHFSLLLCKIIRALHKQRNCLHSLCPPKKLYSVHLIRITLQNLLCLCTLYTVQCAEAKQNTMYSKPCGGCFIWWLLTQYLSHWSGSGNMPASCGQAKSAAARPSSCSSCSSCSRPSRQWGRRHICFLAKMLPTPAKKKYGERKISEIVHKKLGSFRFQNFSQKFENL